MALMILVPGNTLIRRNNQKVGFMRGRGRHDISLNKRRLNRRVRQSAQQEYYQNEHQELQIGGKCYETLELH